MFVERTASGEPVDERVAAAAPGADPVTAQMGLLWAGADRRERRRHPKAAAYAREGLTRPRSTPYLEGALHAQLAQLAMSAGDHGTAARARRRRAADPEPTARRRRRQSLRVIGVMGTLLDGDLDTAERILDEVGGEGAEAGSARR